MEERFWIRGFVRKKRDEDVTNNWPFDGGDVRRKEDIEEFLGDMSVKKFLWWEDVLEEEKGKQIREEEEEEKNQIEEEKNQMVVCPVCQTFKAEKVEIVNKHVNSCLIQTSRQERRQQRSIKAERSKSPRKRSIAEIFSLARQADEVENVGEGIDGNLEAGDKKGKAKNKKRKIEQKEKKKLMVMIMKKKKKQKMVLLKKENDRKFIKPFDTVSFKKKKKKEYKLKKLAASKMINTGCKEQMQYPIQGILKKQSVARGQTSSEVGQAMVADQADVFYHHKVTKHVHFSGNDETFGSENDHLTPNVHPQTQTINKNDSDVMAVSSVNGQPEGDALPHDTSEVAEMNGSGSDVTMDDMNETAFQCFSEKDQLNANEYRIVRPVDMTPNDVICQDKGKGTVDESVTNFQDHECTSAYDPSKASMQGSAALDSLLKATSSPLTSLLSMNTEVNRKNPFLSQATSELGYRPSHQAPPNCHMADICSSRNWKQKEAAVHRDNFTDAVFIGLPLNSHGELVNISTTNRGLDKQKKQIQVTSSVKKSGVPKGSRGCANKKSPHYLERTVPRDNSSLFSEHVNLKERNTPSRAGELQDTGRETIKRGLMNGKNQPLNQLDLNLNLMNSSTCGSSAYDNCKQIETENIMQGGNLDSGCPGTSKPTLRLWGKDITVGQNDIDGIASKDGKAWAERNNLKEHHATLASNIPLASTRLQWETNGNPSSRKLKAVVHTLEPQSNSATSSFWQMGSPHNRTVPTYLNQQAHAIQQSYQNQGTKMPPFSNPLQSLLWMNRTVNMPSNPTHLRSNQRLCNGATSTFQFPFASTAWEVCGQPAPPQCSSQTRPQWMSDLNQQKATLCESSQRYPERNTTYHQNPMLSSNFSSTPIPYGTSIGSYHNHPTTSLPAIHNSSGSAFLVQRPLVLPTSGLRPNSSIDPSYSRKKLIQRRKENDRGKDPRQRAAYKTVGPSEASENANMENKLESSSPFEIGKRIISSCTKGPEKNTTKPRDDNEQNSQKNDMDRVKTTSGFNSSTVDIMARSGPVKLTAGAKHILKPGLSSDQDSSRPIHSTIPIKSVDHSGGVSEASNKSAQVYRF